MNGRIPLEGCFLGWGELVSETTIWSTLHGKRTPESLLMSCGISCFVTNSHCVVFVMKQR